MHYTLIKHRFLTNQSACRVLSILYNGKYTTRKIHTNHIQDLSGIFSISSLVKISMISVDRV